MRGSINGVTLDASRHGDWAGYACTRTLGSIDNVGSRLIDHSVIKTLELDSYALSGHLGVVVAFEKEKVIKCEQARERKMPLYSQPSSGALARSEKASWRNQRAQKIGNACR